MFNGVEVAAYREAAPAPTDGPTILFCGRHEPRKGLAVLLDAMAHLPADVRLWIASDGPETAALQQRVAGDPRIEWLGRITDEEKAAAAARRRRVLRAVARRRVVRRRAARGDGRRHRRSWPATSSATPRSPATASTPIWCRRATPSRLAKALGHVLDDRAHAAELVASGNERAASFSMERLAELYLELYDRGPPAWPAAADAAGDGDPPAPRRDAGCPVARPGSVCSGRWPSSWARTASNATSQVEADLVRTAAIVLAVAAGRARAARRGRHPQRAGRPAGARRRGRRPRRRGPGHGAGLRRRAWSPGPGARRVTEEAQPRLHNLVDGLCVAHGVAKPALIGVAGPAATSPPSPSASGASATNALVVSEPLLDSLSRIELEGVVAQQLSQFQDGSSSLATLVAAARVDAGPRVGARRSPRPPPPSPTARCSPTSPGCA